MKESGKEASMGIPIFTSCPWCGLPREHRPTRSCTGLELEAHEARRAKPTAAAAGPTTGGGRESGSGLRTGPEQSEGALPSSAANPAVFDESEPEIYVTWAKNHIRALEAEVETLRLRHIDEMDRQTDRLIRADARAERAEARVKELEMFLKNILLSVGRGEIEPETVEAALDKAEKEGYVMKVKVEARERED